jgi:hypothetical protein
MHQRWHSKVPFSIKIYSSYSSQNRRNTEMYTGKKLKIIYRVADKINSRKQIASASDVKISTLTTYTYLRYICVYNLNIT